MRRRVLPVLLLLLSIALPTVAPAAPAASSLDLGDPVVVQAAAVAETSEGLRGVLSTVTVAAAANGTGHVFVDTFPLAQVDMQGSARLATRIAARLAGADPGSTDFFFTVRSAAPVIGGPSAGGILTVAALAALLDLPVNESVLMTGTINPDGTIGPVGGIPHKAKAAAEGGATLFLYPKGQDVFRQATTRSVDRGGEETPVQVIEERRMDEYCKAELGITCRPVEDVLDAVEAVTGHRAARAEPAGAVELEVLRRIVEPRTRDLVDGTHTLLASTRADLANATGLTPIGNDTVRDLLDRAEATLRTAEEAARDGRHYTAASRTFHASIQAREADLLIEAAAAARPAEGLRAAHDAAHANATRALSAARSVPLEGALALEAVAAAERRALDALDTLRAVNATLAGDAPDLRALVPDLAYAIERTGTVRWWTDIARDAAADTPAGAAIDPATVQAAAEQVLANARELAAYAQALDPAARTTGAASLAVDAERALAAGLAPAALLLALEADVHAQLALEGAASGDVQAARIERARDAAAAELADAQAAGRAALLAEAGFQFAEDLEDPAQALLHYRIARATARFGLLLDAAPDPVPFEPVPADGPNARVAGAPATSAPGVGALAYAGFATALLGFALGRAAGARR